MKTPSQFAQGLEEHPALPKGDCERVSGYGVIGLPFASGHVLGLRRWTASSVGDRFTSIWHRDPTGRWTFYESAPCQVAYTRYFGGDVERVVEGPIGLEWEASSRQLTGTTSNHQHFDANPLRIWYVTASHAVVEGEDLGPIGALHEQPHIADFYMPQRGIFAVGRVFISPLEQSTLGETSAATATH
jgi:hypothetical protein